MSVSDVHGAQAQAFQAHGQELFRNVRIARQGIFDVQRQLVAYQVRFSSAGRDESLMAEQATSQVIVSTFGTFGLENISGGKPIFIDFTRSFLAGVIPIPVEPARVVVEVPDDIDGDPEVLAGLAALGAEGYRLSIADHRGDPAREAMLAMADFVTVDLSATPLELLPAIVTRGLHHGADLLATSLDDQDTLIHCSELGFKLFQGAVMQRPLVLERQILSPTQLISARLLKDLADPDVPIARVEQRVASDPGLTMQLLRTANSAQSGATAPITSLRQALVMIGPRRLRSWVVLTLLEGGPTSVSADALWIVLTRAHACRRLSAENEDVAFTVGLLSGCAQLLGTELEMVADAAGVGGSARAALLDGEGQPGRALLAVLAHEVDDDEGIAATGYSPFEVSHTYLESLREARRLVVELTGE